MAVVRPEVIWSPTVEDTFLLWNSNLQLYQVADCEENFTVLKISLGEKVCAKQVACNPNYQYIKCVSWYEGGKDDNNHHVIAVGLANGRVAVTSFAKQTDLGNVIGKEFVPKNARQINSLSWNPIYHQYLVAGLDKAGKDHSLIVLDVLQGVPPISHYYDKCTSTSSDTIKPYLELCAGETVSSVEFSRNDPQIVLAGVSNRSIKLYDIRTNSSKSVLSASTKAVSCICSDPFDTHRFASCGENMVQIWDNRNLERSVLNLTDSSNKTISKLSWCPTRCGYLASLPRDCSYFRLYDIQCNEKSESEREDHEPAVITRSISTQPNTALISSFSWHPTHQNRVTIASYSGQLHDHLVMERVMMAFSNKNSLSWSEEEGMLHLLEEESFPPINEDISSIMKKRAINKYGLLVKDLSDNGEITGDPMLVNLWTWLEEARKLYKDHDFKLPDGTYFKYQGIWTILYNGLCRTDFDGKPWSPVEDSPRNVHSKTLSTESRQLALALCSWGFEKESETMLTKFTDKLESCGMFTRAAAISVFNHNIPKAIKILQRGADQQDKPALNITAIALAGYTKEKKALWQETCSSLLKGISDPYIKAMFYFLTRSGDNFDPILQECLMPIQDRIAFACKYYTNDMKLLEYLKGLKTDLIKKGDLNGIILTGSEQEGVELIQRYIDITGDVQTAALIVIHTTTQANPIDPTSIQHHWIEQYRNFLNILQLWKERALMDVMKTNVTGRPAKKTSQQIYVCCNFCHKSVSTFVQAPGRYKTRIEQRYAGGLTSTQKSKMTTCPSCRKPLPRCSLCLQHMGTPSKRGTSKSLHIEDESIKQNVYGKSHSENSNSILSKFDSWFTWCQACYHGGHARHMMDWFKEHTECPVSSCSCKCMNVDRDDRMNIPISK